MFTLVISCLTTSNLPWFMDLTFQVPMQYCSLQHQTLLPSPVPFTTGCCFCFGSIFSFFLELFLHWSPVAFWAPADLMSSSFSVLFAFLYCSWGSQGKNTEVVCHSLLQWTTFCQTSPPRLGHLGWTQMECFSFTELDKAAVHVIRLASCLPSDALLQHLLSYLGFSNLGRGVSSWLLQQSAATAPYLWSWLAPVGHHPGPRVWGSSSRLCSCVITAALLCQLCCKIEYKSSKKNQPRKDLGFLLSKKQKRKQKVV